VPGGAQAAKVSETATGGGLPGRVGLVAGEFIQQFQLKGKKVKGKQVLDVNLTLNANGDPAALPVADLRLIGPKGDNVQIQNPGGSSWVNLKFDDQSTLDACDPTQDIHSDCNYLQGGTTFTGDLNQQLNPTFRGLNPKGTWTLLWIQDSSATAVSVGESILEVKTGRKFAKEDK
jgi:hypothetical protein